MNLIEISNNQYGDITEWFRFGMPFVIYINGGAGTGKSHLIHCIHHEASRILQRGLENPDDVTVLLTAYTGTAAFNDH
jgi:DNA replication protein DnaC